VTDKYHGNNLFFVKISAESLVLTGKGRWIVQELLEEWKDKMKEELYLASSMSG